MTPEQQACRHEAFGAQVNVQRFEDTGTFMAEVSVHCLACKLPFSFTGLPVAISTSRANISIDGTGGALAYRAGSAADPVGRHHSGGDAKEVRVVMTYEDVADMPQRDLGRGLLAKSAPLPAPLVRRLRDAWEVVCGRAEAVRESTIDERERRWMQGGR